MASLELYLVSMHGLFFLLAYNGGTWYHEYPGLGLTGKYLVTSNSNIYSEVHIHWIESSGTATYRGLRPNETTFYQSEIPLLLPPKFPGLFPKWKAPSAFRAQNQIHYVSFIPSRQACLVVKFLIKNVSRAAAGRRTRVGESITLTWRIHGRNVTWFPSHASCTLTRLEIFAESSWQSISVKEEQ